MTEIFRPAPQVVPTALEDELDSINSRIDLLKNRVDEVLEILSGLREILNREL